MPKTNGFYGTPEKVAADVHALFFFDDDANYKKNAEKLCPALGKTLNGLRMKGDFSGKEDEILAIVLNDDRYILVGLGEEQKLKLETLRKAGARAAKESAKFVADTVAMHLPMADVMRKRHIQFEEMVETFVEGALLGLYKFNKYQTKNSEDKKGQIKELKFVTSDEGYQGKIKNAIETASMIIEGVILARDLTNAPANEITPESLAKEANALAKKHMLKIVVLNKKEIETHKMGGLLAVNKGSVKEPRFIIMEYNETKRKVPLYVIIGKGVTFDSGGLSIKPAASMEEMKMDMAGAAAVLGTMHAVAKFKLPVRLVGLIPATDNMSGGDALCPGDVIKISNGKSVEIINTDAEGRLMLADALVYAQRFKPDGMIDLATLTGACAVALASHASGMLGTGEDMKQILKAAGEKTYERVWELPLYDEYDKMLKSNVADMKNTGGKWGGAITAAAFLKSFAGDYPWIHLDIAGTAILDEATEYAPKGGSGVGVRLLTEFFRRIV